MDLEVAERTFVQARNVCKYLFEISCANQSKLKSVKKSKWHLVVCISINVVEKPLPSLDSFRLVKFILKDFGEFGIASNPKCLQMKSRQCDW